jgi:hypothetical protein
MPNVIGTLSMCLDWLPMLNKVGLQDTDIRCHRSYALPAQVAQFIPGNLIIRRAIRCPAAFGSRS